MKIPETIDILTAEDEDEALDRLDALEVEQLLELQKVADRITELLSIVFLSREYGVENDSTNSEM
jgi:hypothetical protein